MSANYGDIGLGDFPADDQLDFVTVEAAPGQTPCSRPLIGRVNKWVFNAIKVRA
jgi:hypothetical protein